MPKVALTRFLYPLHLKMPGLVHMSVGLGRAGGVSDLQNDIPPFVSTFLRRLHSFCVTAAAAGEARGC